VKKQVDGRPVKLTIGHLYPDLMNIYGDRGNILALVNRCRWRGFEAEVVRLSLGDWPDLSSIDLFFFGGGQDRQQVTVSSDLQGDKGRRLVDAAESSAAFLTICGGYQLLGHYYRPHRGDDLPGIGLLDLRTLAGNRRFIGNVVVESELGTLVGFENHSGLTYLGPSCRPLGRVVVGYGNNGRDHQEGVIYKNVYGCYLHGSLLPKNPHLTDHLIQVALNRRYGEVELSPLDDGLEWEAHRAAVERAKVVR
jgi:lipid II isoglutaminyl synthase (glutamine-hydrolysing)